MKFGLGEFGVAPEQGGRSENFTIMTDGRWNKGPPAPLTLCYTYYTFSVIRVRSYLS